MIDEGRRRGSFGGVEIEEGEMITVDGTTGLVFRGEVPVKKVKPKKLVDEVLRWRKAGAKR